MRMDRPVVRAYLYTFFCDQIGLQFFWFLTSVSCPGIGGGVSRRFSHPLSFLRAGEVVEKTISISGFQRVGFAAFLPPQEKYKRPRTTIFPTIGIQ